MMNVYFMAKHVILATKDFATRVACVHVDVPGKNESEE